MNLLTLNFWFNIRPEPIKLQYQIILFSLFLFLLIIFIVTEFYSQKIKKISKKTIRKIANFSLTNSLLAFFWWLANNQLIPIFSAKFWLILWLITIFTWLFFINKSFQKEKKFQQEKLKNKNKEKEYKKYLPK